MEGGNIEIVKNGLGGMPGIPGMVSDIQQRPHVIMPATGPVPAGVIVFHRVSRAVIPEGFGVIRHHSQGIRADLDGSNLVS